MSYVKIIQEGAITVVRQPQPAPVNITVKGIVERTGGTDTTYIDAALLQEQTARQQADDSLQNSIEANSLAIATETTNRSNADAALQSQIGINADAIANNATAISNEATTRASADSNLQSQLSANATAISAETTSRTNADASLQSQIDTNTTAIGWKLDKTDTTDALAEGSTNKYFTSARTIAAALTGYIKSAANRAVAATDSILTAIGVLEKKIEDNTVSISSNATAINSEISNRANADISLQSQITTNTTSIGTLSTLATTAKSDLVGAVNEVRSGAMRYLGGSHVANSVTGTANNAETTLYTLSIPGNTLGPNSTIQILARFSFTTSGASNNKTFKFKFGTNIIMQSTQNTAVSVCQLLTFLQNRNARNINFTMPFGTGSNIGVGGNANSALSTYAIDFSVDQTFTITGALQVGTDTMALESVDVLVVN